MKILKKLSKHLALDAQNISIFKFQCEIIILNNRIHKYLSIMFFKPYPQMNEAKRRWDHLRPIQELNGFFVFNSIKILAK